MPTQRHGWVGPDFSCRDTESDLSESFATVLVIRFAGSLSTYLLFNRFLAYSQGARYMRCTGMGMVVFDSVRFSASNDSCF